MTFEQASAVVIPFGKYKYSTIDRAARSDGGLLWLDWARGVARSGRFKYALDVYLRNEAVARDLEALIEDKA